MIYCTVQTFLQQSAAALRYAAKITTNEQIAASFGHSIAVKPVGFRDFIL